VAAAEHFVARRDVVLDREFARFRTVTVDSASKSTTGRTES